jgi:2-methylcitrate dehydratase PrpD
LRPEEIETIAIDVDSVTPTVLIHSTPATGLEAKFSMPFCVAAAIVDGAVGIDSFAQPRISDPRIVALMPRISMGIDRGFDGAFAPLTRARVRLSLRGGRVVEREAHGARGYPQEPASRVELDAKFIDCARPSLSGAAADRALEGLRGLEQCLDIRSLLFFVHHGVGSEGWSSDGFSGPGR